MASKAMFWGLGATAMRRAAVIRFPSLAARLMPMPSRMAPSPAHRHSSTLQVDPTKPDAGKMTNDSDSGMEMTTDSDSGMEMTTDSDDAANMATGGDDAATMPPPAVGDSGVRMSAQELQKIQEETGPWSDFTAKFVKRFNNATYDIRVLVNMSREEHAEEYIKLTENMFAYLVMSRMKFTTFLRIRFTCLSLVEFANMVLVDSLNVMRHMHSSLPIRVRRHMHAVKAGESTTALATLAEMGIHPAEVHFGDAHSESRLLKELFRIMKTRLRMTLAINMRGRLPARLIDVDTSTATVVPEMDPEMMEKIVREAAVAYSELTLAHATAAKNWQPHRPF